MFPVFSVPIFGTSKSRIKYTLVRKILNSTKNGRIDEIFCFLRVSEQGESFWIGFEKKTKFFF